MKKAIIPAALALALNKANASTTQASIQ
jgi:hypothetical protein